MRTLAPFAARFVAMAAPMPASPFRQSPCLECAYFLIVDLSRTACAASDNGKLAFVNSRSSHIRQCLSILPRSVRVRIRK